MSTYSRITMEQAAVFYRFIKFLKRLRIIGHLEAHTEQAYGGIDHLGAYDLVDMTGADYSIVKDGYSRERRIMAEELLEEIYGRQYSPQYRGSY